MSAELAVHRAGMGASSGVVDADPITTEVVRHGLNAAADQMKRALLRTAFSVVIYEALDFAPAIYDRRVRLLAQAPSQPLFMGTLNFCVEHAVEAVGGEQGLDPGDIILINYPFATGSHPQDGTLVMPVFHDQHLVGYTAIKAHWLDIGAKAPYCTDTTDAFQEGTIFPGVKLVKRGLLDEQLLRIVIANSRVPDMVVGDINAQIVGVRTGSDALVRLVDRYGLETFENSIERMFDHGEALVRSYFEQIPDGRYVGEGIFDDDGITDDPIPFEVVVEIDGSDVRIDYSRAPDQQRGPMNTPLPTTVSVSRVAIMALAGGGEDPNEGHFRPLQVVTRPGSMYHPLPPAANFLYGKPGIGAIEAIYNGLAKAMPDKVPAGSNADTCILVWWGAREQTGERWADGSGHPAGQGAQPGRDGASALLHIAAAGCRFSPIEVWEAKNPWLLEKVELAQDSGGAGRHRGGLGIDMCFRMREDTWVTAPLERTRFPAWPVAGGRPGRPNAVVVRHPDGSLRPFSSGKLTSVALPRGTVLELKTGGGGGWGPPEERNPESVRRDLELGYISERHARAHHGYAVR